MSEEEDFEFTMVTKDGCPYCQKAKDMPLIKEGLASGAIKELNISESKENWELANKHEVDDVPTFIVKNKKLETFQTCDLAKDGTRLLCKDKEMKL